MPPPILVSGLGKKSIELAARGDGYVPLAPERDRVAAFRSLLDELPIQQTGGGHDEFRVYEREVLPRFH